VGGLSFVWLYWRDRGEPGEHWWPLIPGGVLLSLAIVALMSTVWEGESAALGAVFLFGVAATFAVLSLIRTPHGRMIWALITAGVFGLLAFVVLIAFTSASVSVPAVALVLVGFIVLYRQSGGDEIAG
jgi:hypothetical protein